MNIIFYIFVFDMNTEGLPWVEKFRPKKIDEIIHQSVVVKLLMNSLNTNNLQHMLFYGPPGTGKTSMISAFCNEIFTKHVSKDKNSSNLLKTRVKLLNASNERGIDVVRNDIINFAKLKISSVGPPFKIIILDEADSMTHDAQTALRRTIEEYSHITIFCFICNYESKIIDAIKSRCAIYRFEPLPKKEMRKRLQMICEKESVTIDKKSSDFLLDISRGDMRQVLNILQSAVSLNPQKTSIKTLKMVAGVIPERIIESIYNDCKNKSSKNRYKNVSKMANEMLSLGYPILRIYNSLIECIINDEDITDYKKAKFIQFISDSDNKIRTSADPYIQLVWLFNEIQYEMQI